MTEHEQSILISFLDLVLHGIDGEAHETRSHQGDLEFVEVPGDHFFDELNSEGLCLFFPFGAGHSLPFGVTSHVLAPPWGKSRATSTTAGTPAAVEWEHAEAKEAETEDRCSPF